MVVTELEPVLVVAVSAVAKGVELEVPLLVDVDKDNVTVAPTTLARGRDGHVQNPKGRRLWRLLWRRLPIVEGRNAPAPLLRRRRRATGGIIHKHTNAQRIILY